MENLSIRIISNGIFPRELSGGLEGALRVELELARELNRKGHRVQVLGRSKEDYSEES